MKEIFLGEYIRQERLKQGITQEQLCEGICEPITVSRMENGKQTPSYSRVRAFLQRLGLPDNRYFALLSKSELEIKTLEDEIRADSIRFERATQEDRLHIQTAGLQKLEQLEKLAEPDDRIVRQYIMSERATFGKPDGSYSPGERLKLLLEALHITVPNLDLEEINLSLYSMEEKMEKFNHAVCGEPANYPWVELTILTVPFCLTGRNIMTEYLTWIAYNCFNSVVLVHSMKTLRCAFQLSTEECL